MNIFIVGISGKMGKAVCEKANSYGCTVVGGLDKIPLGNFPTFESADKVNVPIDVIIDFSRPETLPQVITLADKFHCPCVMATTGYSQAQEEQIAKLSTRVAVFKSANMSVGVNVISKLLQTAAQLLEGYDIELIERHHNQKADAPSGTAKLLCKSLEKGLSYSPAYRYGRDENSGKREKGDIGVHAVRGGTVVGEHEIAFYGSDETVTISHTALSRSVFADGALRAALFLNGKKSGLFDMSDMLREGEK